MTVRLKLSALYSALPPAERKAADFIMANPDKAAHMIISDIAKASNVSIPSVTRLAKKLGYGSFLEFRIALAEPSAGASGNIADTVLGGDSDEAFIRRLMLEQMHAIDLTFRMLSKERLRALANEFAAAKRIVFFGTADALSVLYVINDEFVKMGLDSIIIHETDSVPAYVARLGKGDVLFALSRAEASARMLDCLKTAKKRGATTVFMTNLLDSPAKQIAEHFIFTSRLDTAYALFGFETDSAQKALLEVIAALVAKKLGYTGKNESETAATVNG